ARRGTSASPEVSSVATAPTKSPAAAKTKPPTGKFVTMEEYGDYQCPPCGLLYPELKKIEAEYGSNLRMVFHHLPLTRIHKNALAAAHAAEAAGRQNHFWEMHDRLYRNQKAWSDEGDPRSIFIGYARELGLDVERFTRDMDSPEVDSRITADTQQATSLGIIGTPTILIDGRQLRPEATTPEGIKQGIDFMLTQKGASPSS
ncbi:MAG: thioredoxin domain-containing protein, partial [Pyrinomonadaceae bacterium]